MNRFFVPSEGVSDGNVTIKGSDVNHIKNVLRMREGEHLDIVCGMGSEYECEIREISSDRIILTIVKENTCDRELPARIHLFQGLPKSDKLELIIQKCVELGVYEIIPVSMARSIVKTDPKKAAGKLTRYNAISEAAAKQSKRQTVPEVHDFMGYKEALKYACGMDMILLPYELAEGMEGTRRALSEIKPGMDVAVFIGPEGGFDPAEVSAAEEAGAKVISLGRRILRTETAGLAVMSMIVYQIDRM